MPRQATAADREGVAETLALAFENDPVWGRAIPGAEAQARWWRLLVEGALHHPCVWVEGDYAAVSVWIPPGASELSPAEEEQVEPLVGELAGDRAGDVLELLEQFDETHPHGEPHNYLSLLGVHPDHRGKGLGMQLVADNLVAMDAEGIPAYLESTNPTANRRRYEKAGFAGIGEWTSPGGQVVEQMWRPVGG